MVWSFVYVLVGWLVGWLVHLVGWNVRSLFLSLGLPTHNAENVCFNFRCQFEVNVYARIRLFLIDAARW